MLQAVHQPNNSVLAKKCLSLYIYTVQTFFHKRFYSIWCTLYSRDSVNCSTKSTCSDRGYLPLLSAMCLHPQKWAMSIYTPTQLQTSFDVDTGVPCVLSQLWLGYGNLVACWVLSLLTDGWRSVHEGAHQLLAPPRTDSYYHILSVFGLLRNSNDCKVRIPEYIYKCCYVNEFSCPQKVFEYNITA